LIHINELNRPLGISKRRREDNIKMHLQDEGCECNELIELVLNRDRWGANVNGVINFRVPKNAGNP
jgi:hypothetical protein